MRARGSSESVLGSFDGRAHANAQNRWQGGNLGHYANPAFDRLVDQLSSTLDEQQQGRIFKDIMEIMATDLPELPMYFAVTFAVARKGVDALKQDYAGMRDVGVLARNAHIWDRD